MQCSINPALWGQVFAVPTEITDRYIRLCPGVALKCLLLVLRDPTLLGDPQAIAQRLGQSISEVNDAFVQLTELGILLSGEQDTPPRPAPPVSPVPPLEHKAPQPIQQPTPQPAQPAAKPTSAPLLATRPQFPREEAVSIVESDETLHGLLQELQSMMGKLFTSADLDVLIALYSFYALTPHYIITVVNYCISIGRASMGYAEKVASSWIAEGIDDEGIDRHVDRLGSRRSNEGRVRTAFGIHDRNLTSRERDYIAAWFDQYQFDLPLIEYAYEVTVERTGKLAFGYLNKILASWHQNGIRTLEEAKRESKSITGAQSSSAKPAQTGGGLDRKILEQFMKD